MRATRKPLRSRAEVEALARSWRDVARNSAHCRYPDLRELADGIAGRLEYEASRLQQAELFQPAEVHPEVGP